MAAVGLAGALAWVSTQAATYSIAAEAESGTKAGPAETAGIEGSSGGQAIRFTTSANPTPGGDCSQARIQQLVDSVSQANVDANLRALVQDDTKPTPNEKISRHISSPGNKQKTDWMKQKLAGYGLTDQSQNFTASGRSLTNPIGRLTGSIGISAIYALGAHIDSQSDSPATLAPGADDNASGVAAVIEAARVLKPFQSCMKATVDFIGFNDEEEGMGGSQLYARNANKTAFKGLLNMDMIGYADVNGQCIKSYYKNAAREQALAQRVADVNTKYKIGLAPITVKQYPSSDIDSASFWSAGLPATYQGECIDDDGTPDLPGYHSTDDTLADVSVPMVTKTTKAVVAALAELTSQ